MAYMWSSEDEPLCGIRSLHLCIDSGDGTRSSGFRIRQGSPSSAEPSHLPTFPGCRNHHLKWAFPHDPTLVQSKRHGSSVALSFLIGGKELEYGTVRDRRGGKGNLH